MQITNVAPEIISMEDYQETAVPGAWVNPADGTCIFIDGQHAIRITPEQAD